MAKTSMINRELKRQRVVKKYAVRRSELKAKIKDMALSDEERFEARIALNKMPRDSSPSKDFGLNPRECTNFWIV